MPEDAGIGAASSGAVSKKRAAEDFQRAYKACINCRARKARCVLTTDGNNLVPPCQRCRREMRECVFRAERSWTKRPKQSSLEPDPNEPPDQAVTNVSFPSIIRNGKSGARRTSGAASIPPITYDNASPIQERARRASSPVAPGRLADSVMRTVVSSSNDALNLLFEAAHHRDTLGPPNDPDTTEPSPNNQPLTYGSGDTPPAMSSSRGRVGNLSKASPETLRTWNACRFVQIGWFSAQEAVTYVDLFFKNLSFLSPVLSDFYSDHQNHLLLISRDPFLCSTILMISSRYNILPGVGGMPRSYFIHDRLWEQCQRFIMMITLGQEKASRAKTRTIGSIEALLLIAEWHPRALHFSTGSDGWDAELMSAPLCTTHTDDDDLHSKDNFSSSRWLEDVVEPAKRSDRMSWMLLGCGLALAHELGIFDENSNFDKAHDASNPMPAGTKQFRCIRAQKLLYVFIEQLSFRLGCTSMIPQSLNHVLLAKPPLASISPYEELWLVHMSAWVELTKISKSVSDMLFPSAAVTRKTLRSGRYVGLLQHFQSQLKQWLKKHGNMNIADRDLNDMMCMEYQYVRIHTNSLGMQAVVERTLAEADANGLQSEALPLNIEPLSIDYDFIQEVVDGSCDILLKAIRLAETGALHYAPVRVILRTVTASVFLIKSLSLGAPKTRLESSLEILDNCINALRTSTMEDGHLAARYATLLELHVTRLRNNLIISARPPMLPPRQASVDSPAGLAFLSNQNAGDSGIASLVEDINGMMYTDDWLSLPFNPSMAPFEIGTAQTAFGTDEGNLDFFWDLPA
ncbi:C6 transcription factor-like protein [Mytilinidion resinicola]|uniref:C6 transcription factor-like protein n=1 Tax=Mytilinidion resinicola TaxID=574789 RepID=A0A6A6YV80_9PEZI|nr:C6 transcription factor-like protein [Mytilinidion resinicola]KAF2811894.1 C6 transcription factor-like protein [Mytilinidion resinicola]